MIIFSHSKDGETIKTRTSLFFYLNNYVYHFSKPSRTQIRAASRAKENKAKKLASKKIDISRRRK